MKYIIVILILFFISCNNNYHITEDEKLVNAITAITARKLQTEKNLTLIGTGGSMMDGVEMLAMDFQFFNMLEINEARSLIVSAVNEYLAEINNNQAIRSYLVSYPFEPKNVEIDIWIRNPDGSFPEVGKIKLISACNGILEYCIQTQNSILGKVIQTETYEEAVDKLNNQNKVKI